MSADTTQKQSSKNLLTHPFKSIEIIVADLDRMLDKTGKALYSGLGKAQRELLEWLCISAPNHIANSLPIIRRYSLALLTLIIGIAFGFAPMGAFLSILEDLSGPMATILRWAIIVPSCSVQSILWWESYYGAAISTLEQPRRHRNTNNQDDHTVDNILERIQLITSTLGRPDIEQKCSTLLTQQPGPALKLAKTMLSTYEGLDWNAFVNIRDHWRQKSDRAIKDNLETANHILDTILSDTQANHADLNDDLLVTHLDTLEQFINDELSKEEKNKGLMQQFFSVSVGLLTETINFLNYATINPFGVFFAFYTALLTITLPGLPLASIILPIAAKPILIGLLGLGYTAGFVGAFYLTSNAFRRVIERGIYHLIEKLTPNDQSLKRQALQLRDELRLRIRRVSTDPTWRWLTNRPKLGATLAIGCALSVCILNYYAGIQTAILLTNISLLLTPGALLSSASILNATISQKLFGIYSAIITFGMTSALLMDTASTAKTEVEAQTIRKDSNHNGFFWIATTLSGLGQLFCNYVYTIKPHGILSALRLMNAPYERLLQGLYGLLSIGGTVLICKLQGDAADNIIKKGFIPSKVQVSNHVRGLNDTANHLVEDIAFYSGWNNHQKHAKNA